MQSSILRFFLLAGVFLVRAAEEPQDSQEVHALLHRHKATAQVSFEIWAKDWSKILAKSCSTGILDHGLSVSFDVDENGAGNFTFGTATYVVHENAGILNGVTCGRIHSEAESVTSCSLFLPKTFSSMSQEANLFCIDDESARLPNVFKGFTGATFAHPMAPTASNTSSLSVISSITKKLRRQGACGVTSGITYRVGDGNPHQNPMNVQMSQPIHCGQGDCYIQHGEYTSKSVDWFASAGAFEWINAGFEVEMSIETGNDYGCSGHAGDVFAVWCNQAQTAYTVQNANLNQCTGTENVGGNYVMWSPNDGNRDGYYYCVYGAQYVRNEGDRWLDTSGRAGGP